MRNSDQEIRTAYAECRKLARRHYENFPVASRLVPPDKRDALAAIYAFARGADDFADEPKAVGAIQVRCRDSDGVQNRPSKRWPIGARGLKLAAPGTPAPTTRCSSLLRTRCAASACRKCIW